VLCSLTEHYRSLRDQYLEAKASFPEDVRLRIAHFTYCAGTRSAGTHENARLMIEGERLPNREESVADKGLLHLFVNACNLYSLHLAWGTVLC
jgi:hypothetical protein